MNPDTIKDWHKVAERNERNGIRRRIHVANPTDRSWPKSCFVFWFGSCAPTYVLAYGGGIDDCLEAAADWLSDHAPGHIMAHDSEELKDLIAEAREEFVNNYERFPDDNEEGFEIMESATGGLTYTEAGYLTSYEWGISLDNPTAEQLLAFVKG